MGNFKYIVFTFFCISAINCGKSLVGAPQIIEREEQSDIESLFRESLRQLKGQEDGADLCLLEISSVTQQVVSGLKYKFNAKMEHCTEKTPKKCKITLWRQEWLKFQDTKFDCEDSSNYRVTNKNEIRTKRDTTNQKLIGGPTEVDASTLDELKKNVTESFVGLQSDQSKSIQLKEVLGADKKVVSGVLYTLYAIIDSGNGPHKCNIELWSKPWINFREIAVKCDNGENYKIEHDNRPKRSAKFRPLFEDHEQQDSEELDADSAESHFSRFKQNFGRTYKTDEEEAMRFRIFQNNLYLIQQLNKFEQGSAVYGVTDFADFTQDEYFQRTGLLKRNLDGDDDLLTNEIPNPFAEIPDIELPKSKDWRDLNAVTPVKNQGNCGSCWAFSVTGNIEGLNAIKSGELKSFSEQELVDCDDLDAGCNGGLPDNAVKFIEKEGGLELETDYPYTAHRAKSCNFNKSLSRVQVSGVIDFKKGDEESMAKWLTSNGPISIGINANAMQFYRGGISHPWKALCKPSSLDHGVLIVGFGVAEYPALNKTMPYWIIKNSWGERWGEAGYYRIHRGDNSCGVSSMASSAVLTTFNN